MPVPIPENSVVLAWAEFSEKHELLYMRTDETLDELLVRREEVSTLQVR